MTAVFYKQQNYRQSYKTGS